MRIINAQATAVIYLDTRSTKKGNVFPVKLKITYERERLYIPLNTDMSELDFHKMMAGNVRGKLLDLRTSFEKEKAHAYDVINALATFNFKEFKRNFGVKSVTKSLDWYYLSYIQKLKDNKQLRTADSYHTAYKKLTGFFGKEFSFSRLSKDDLSRFERSLEQDGRSLSTVGVYLRCLRTIYNLAIDDGAISRSDYPFGRNKYVIPSTRKRKLGLATNHLRVIANHTFEDPKHAYYRDLWLFSFYCNGMNMKDIAFLKYRNISHNILQFVRLKTANTNRQNRQEIALKLSFAASRIIVRWGNKPRNKDSYIFPIITQDMTPERQIAAYQQTVKMSGQMIKNIGEANKWKGQLNFMSARHSFGNLLQKSNQPLHVIQRALGHTDPKTTEHYLQDLDVSKMYEIAELTKLQST
jgi:integrase